MRFEVKHQQFKQEARRCGYKNVCLTLSRFHQRLQAFTLQYNQELASLAVKYGAGKMHLKDTSFTDDNNIMFNN